MFFLIVLFYVIYFFLFFLQKEWLCLNCQTQKAMSSQLGDVPPPSMASPKKQSPAPPSVPLSSPAPAAVDSKPVVEAVDPSPPASETKVAPETLLDSTLISPEHMSSTLENSAQETLQSDKSKQPLADGSVSENHPENKLLNSESLAERNTTEQPQINSEKKAEDTEAAHSNQQTQNSAVSEISAVEQQQRSSEKAAEDHSFYDTETPYVNQEEQSAVDSKIQAVEQHQSSFENVAENCLPSVVDDKQTQLTKTDLDNTSYVEVENKQDVEKTQSEGGTPSADHEAVEPSPEKLLEVTTNSPEVTLEEPLTEKPQVIPAEQLSTPVESAIDINQTHITENCGADRAESGLTNSVTENALSVTEPESSAGPTDNIDTPEVKTDLKVQSNPTKCTESESSSAGAKEQSVSDSDGRCQSNEMVNKPIETEEPLTTRDIVNSSPAVAPLGEESQVIGKAQEENTFQNTVPFNVADNRKTTMKEVPEGADNWGSLDSEINEDAIEVKANEGKTLEERRIEEEIIETANDPKLLDKGDDKAESSEAASSADTANICSSIERNELEKSGEPVVNVPEQILKDVEQINKEIQQIHVEENDKSLARGEEGLSKNEKQTFEDPMLNADMSDKAVVLSDTPPFTPREQEKLNDEVPVKSEVLVSALAALSETELRDKTCEGKGSTGEAEAGSQMTSSAAENQNEPQKNSELSIKGGKAESDRGEDESQFVVGNSQETISVSEASAECHKDGTAVFDVGIGAASKKSEVSESPPVMVPSVPVAEPKIQSVVSEQDEGSNEENKEKKMYAENKVKIVFSSCSYRLYHSLILLFV